MTLKVRKSAVDVTINLKNTAEKMRTQGAQITEAGESTSNRNETFSFTPLADEDLTQYGLIVTFNQDVIGGIKEYPTHYSQWVKIKQDNVWREYYLLSK